MKRNRFGHNCHGVAVDVFMQMAVRHRWEEVRDFWPDDYHAPPIDVLRVDDSWIDLRTLENLNAHERRWLADYKSVVRKLNRPSG